jgi:sporulation protein YlmC with PRC-barrel domain
MMNTEQLKGLAVVSQEEGAKLGQVDTALFDPQTLALRAFQVRGEGQTFLVPFDEVVAIGADALMVRSSQVTQAAASGGAFGQLVDLGTLKQLQVVDATGTLLGTVRDVELDDTSGHVLRLVVHKGGLLGFGGETLTVAASAIRGVGAQLITVGAVETPPTT